MNPADRAKYKPLYLETSRQYIEKITNALSMMLEDQPNDEQVKEIFIATHSLAGQSMMIGYNQIGEYAALIQKAVEDKHTLDKELLEIMERGVEKLTTSLEDIEMDDKESDLSEELALLQNKIGGNK